MGRPVARWHGLGKWISGIVVLCFFLPFFGVSCDGVDVVHFSGTDMVAGCAPGGMMVDMAEQGEAKHGGRGGDMTMEAKIDKVDVEPLAIVAFAAALIGFASAWKRSKGARALSLAFALVSLGALGGMFVTVKSKLDDQIADQNKAKKGGLEHEMKKDVKIEAGVRFGWFVTAFGLLTLAALAGSALKQGEDPPEPASAPVA